MQAGETYENFLLDNIPQELKTRSQWVVWKRVERGDKQTKVPLDPGNGGSARTNAPYTWKPFDLAVQRQHAWGCGGIGYVFSENDPYVGIDLDNCRDPETGILERWAVAIIERLDSYTEASPSGTGVHIFVKATLPPGGRKKGSIEMYSEGRFFTVTGEHIGGTPTTIENRTAELSALHVEVFGKSQEPANAGNGSVNGQENPLLDEEIIVLAKQAKNREKFIPLWDGSTVEYPSSSEADQALCNILAFYCGPDPVRIDRLFRQSGLYRKKWDEKHFSNGHTYGEATIKKALTDKQEFYAGAGSKTHARYRGYEPPEETAEESVVSAPPWPELAEDALYGLAGDIVRAIDPYTEADPVATLTNTLTAFGNCINSSAHAKVQHDHHPARLN
ncbi:MAG: hypothetical protein ACRERD_17595, partial [Candidatus Binatia bacterium]